MLESGRTGRALENRQNEQTCTHAEERTERTLTALRFYAS
jgi:hypothetical protein